MYCEILGNFLPFKLYDRNFNIFVNFIIKKKLKQNLLNITFIKKKTLI